MSQFTQPRLPEPDHFTLLQPDLNYMAKLETPRFVDNPRSIHFYLSRCDLPASPTGEST